MLKLYHHSGFQNSGEKIRHRFAEADWLEAGGLNPLGEKSKVRCKSLTFTAQSSHCTSKVLTKSRT
jgi:hypothetical protein